ncbi:hypothetical protein VLK31_07020 [Variovorax sp. H27-G14]|uniref:hypothetical protein n=1 Tax=Variovorax sp. H27-G14 TaxID=3111914 RepID=UPI0038FC19CF
MNGPNFPHIVHKPMPARELQLELEPLPQNYRGFVRRLSPVTQEELAAMDLRENFAVSEQQRREGGAS